MKDKITKLLEVKKLIALMITVLFCIMTIRRDISSEMAMLIVSTVITFYFNSSIEKERNKTK